MQFNREAKAPPQVAPLRVLRPDLRRSSYVLGIGLALALAAASGALADGGQPAPIPVTGNESSAQFTVSRQHPVAGKTFRGLTIRTTDPQDPILSVNCTARIGGQFLRAHKRVSYNGNQKDAVTCSWRIPARAGGKRLSLGHVRVDNAYSYAVSPAISWRIRRRSR